MVMAMISVRCKFVHQLDCGNEHHLKVLRELSTLYMGPVDSPIIVYALSELPFRVVFSSGFLVSLPCQPVPAKIFRKRR